MPIKVTAPDGTTVTFPDGTPEATIRSAMSKEFGGPKPAPRQPQPARSKPAPQKGFFGQVADYAGTALRGLQSGILSEADDEISAGLSTVVPGWGGSVWEQDGSIGERFGKSYNAAVNAYRRDTRRDQQERPVVRALSQGVGAVAPILLTRNPGAMPKVAPRPVPNGPVRRVAEAATVGAAQGSVAGFNAGEGTLKNRLDSAEMGAVTGLVAGTGFAALGELAPIAKRYWDTLRGKGSREEAMRQLTSRLKADGYDLSDPAGQAKLTAALDEYDAVGKPAALADVGPGTRKRTGVALRTQNDNMSSGRDIVEGRLADAEGRLKNDVFDTVAPKDDVYGESDIIVNRRRQAAGPAYEQAYQQRFVTSDTLDEITNRPSMRRGLNYAAELAKEEGKNPLGLGFVFDEAGDVKYVERPSMETYDYIQRALNDDIRANTVVDAFGREKPNAKAVKIRGTRDTLVSELDRINPDFAATRGAYRSESELLNAIEDGRKYNSQDPEQITVNIGRLSEPAQDMYRVGVARDLNDRLGNTTEGANPALRILKNTNEKGRLAATGANVDELGRRVGMERNLGLLNQELRGSQSDERLGERALSSEVPTTGRGLLGKAWDYVLQAPSLQRNQAINSEIIPMALEMDPAARSKLIEELIREGKRGEEVARKIQRAVTAATVVTSQQVGGATAIRQPILTEE